MKGTFTKKNGNPRKRLTIGLVPAAGKNPAQAIYRALESCSTRKDVDNFCHYSAPSYFHMPTSREGGVRLNP